MSSLSGIARLSIIPLRKESRHASEQVSQLLFGEHYKVLEMSEDKEWVKIELNFDQYQGWIAINQHTPITEEHFEKISWSDYKITTDVYSTILVGKRPVNIPMGSIIPISGNELFDMTEKLAFTGNSKVQSQKREPEFLINVAKKYINAPYLWGGKSPFGIDCSGLAQMVYKIAGYSLPRDTSQQIQTGIEVSFEDAQPGDLVFFENIHKKMDHVGIYLGDGKVIHASGIVRIDKLKTEGLFNADLQKLTHFNPRVFHILGIAV